MAKKHYHTPMTKVITLYLHEHILSCSPKDPIDDETLPDDRDTECPLIIDDEGIPH